MKNLKFIELIQNNINPNTKIQNWSIDNKIRIPYYTFLGIKNGKCILEHPKTKKEIEVPEKSFQYLYENWNDYKNGKPRNELRDGDNFTTYTICIFHYLEINNIL